MKKNVVLLKKINLLENQKLIQFLSRLSLSIFLIFLAVLVGYIVIDPFVLQNEFRFLAETEKVGWQAIILLVSGKVFILFLLFFLSLILHEGIHGLFFKIFGAKKVRFGFKKGMAYAEAAGSYFRPWQFSVIALSPFCVLSLLYLLLGQLYPISALLLAAMHTSGCVGDFYFVYLLSKFKGMSWIEDTKNGINLYENG